MTATTVTTITPVVGITGTTEFFWTVVRAGRLLASGISATEDDARFDSSEAWS